MTLPHRDKGWRPEAPPLQGRGLGWGLSVTQLRWLHARAAEMRRNPTEPEKRLWRHLSNSQLAGAKFRRQSVIGRFIADLHCPARSLIVEVDGDTHDDMKDRLRDDELAEHGLRVFRVTNLDVMTNVEGVLAAIVENLHPDMPHPNPSPQGEGLRDALTAATARFGFSATPRLDAELLFAHAAGISRDQLLLNPPEAALPDFAALVERRAAQEPVAYLTGRRAFWTIELEVGPGVLIPRADSETLIEAAVAHFGQRAPRTILDLGTGPGTLLLAALDQWPDAAGVGVDASDRALDYARRNAARLGLADRAAFRSGGWGGTGERFDLILCNPPYIATGEALPREVADYEPAEALYAGPDGLDDYRVLAPLLSVQLAPGGCACIEIGHTQAAAVTALLAAQGLAVSLRRDLGSRDRCLIATPGGRS